MKSDIFPHDIFEIIIFHNYVVRHNFHKCPRMFIIYFWQVLFYLFLGSSSSYSVHNETMWLTSWSLIIGESFLYYYYLWIPSRMDIGKDKRHEPKRNVLYVDMGHLTIARVSKSEHCCMHFINFALSYFNRYFISIMSLQSKINT
jgi:hypothetical protein